MRERLAILLLVLSGVAILVGSLVQFGAGGALIALGIWAALAGLLLGLAE